MTTLTNAAGLTRPRDRRGWPTADLPPVIHTMTSRFGEHLEARVVRPGQRFGVDGVLSDLAPTKVEVRTAGRLEAAFGFPGRVVALLDVTDLQAGSAACWQLLHEAMPYAIEPDQWRSLLAAVDAALDGDQP